MPEKWHVRNVRTGETVSESMTRGEAQRKARESGWYRLFPGAKAPKAKDTKAQD